MYVIRINGNDLYYPGDEYCCISSGKYSEELGSSGSLEFTMPAINPYYDSVLQRSTEIQLYKDEELIFNGEVREIDVDFWKNKRVYCVGELSYLNDSIQSLNELKGTRTQVFAQLIASHNTQTDARKHYLVGAIGEGGQNQCDIVTDYVSTLEALQMLLKDEEYFRIRHENGQRYIDIMPIDLYGEHSSQYVEFSENLIDLAVNNSSEDLATACIPLGASLDESPVEGTTAYLDITSVMPDGRNYVFSQDAVNNYGWIKRVVHFNVLTDANALKTAGDNWLAQNQFEKFSYNLTAVDLSMVEKTVDDYRSGDYIRAISAPHGMDAWLPIRKRDIDILNLANNKITVGASGTRSLTQSISGQITALEEKMPDRDDILKSALNNAKNLINANGSSGYVSIRQDETGKPYEILIMNKPSIEESTQAWRWNLAGFGHGTKAEGTDIWDWSPDVAITMDGSIVANAITSGILNSIEIIGGSTGTFHVTTDGTITANKGSISGFNMYHRQTVASTLTDRLEHGDEDSFLRIVGQYIDDRPVTGYIQLRNDGGGYVMISSSGMSINGYRVLTTADIEGSGGTPFEQMTQGMICLKA